MAEIKAAAQLSAEQKTELLRLCLETIRVYSQECRVAPYQTEDPALLRHAAVFVTLRIRGMLRGCVGQVHPDYPLYLAVQNAGIAAGFADPRFPELCEQEIPQLQIKIAVLSPMEPILPEQVIIGKHGLLITSGRQRGLLLPEVAAERGWDLNTYLESLCLKAGLPCGAWQGSAHLFAFTTEVME